MISLQRFMLIDFVEVLVMIEVKNLVKSYGKKRALDNISFSVKRGEILGFLGPNGAGKSTTMNILTGYLSSTSGSVEIDGIDVMEKPIKTKEKIGYLPENPPLYQDMTVEDYLSFVFDLKKVKENKQKHLEEICEITGIIDVCKRLIKNLSKGYKQRVGLAQALIGFPPVLILDEPTVGLDPKQIIEIRNLIKNFANKHTVILSSHVLSEIQAICERVLVINNGKIVADDTPEKLSANIAGNEKLHITIDGNEEKVYDIIKNTQGVVTVQKLGKDQDGNYSFDIECLPNCDMRKTLARAVNSTGAILLSAVNIQLSLEDIFLKLTENDEMNEKLFDDNTDNDLIKNSIDDKSENELPGDATCDEFNTEKNCCDDNKINTKKSLVASEQNKNNQIENKEKQDEKQSNTDETNEKNYDVSDDIEDSSQLINNGSNQGGKN